MMKCSNQRMAVMGWLCHRQAPWPRPSPVLADRNEACKPATSQYTSSLRICRRRGTRTHADARVAYRLQGLLADVECSGKQVHDASVIATMLAHGAGTVVTMNLADFARFRRYVSLVEL
jgi:predicted nucleic acid-binding protein